MPCEYVWTPVFYIAFRFFAVSFNFSHRFHTHPLKMGAGFFRSRFFQTLVTLPLLRGVGLLCCYGCYSHQRTETPFLIPSYTKLLLVFPPNCICHFPSLCLFPLHLKHCCLYGAFRKQMGCSVEICYYFTLVDIHACARDQM